MNERLRSLLPHSGVAILVERIVEAGGDSIICRARVPQGSPFSNDGRVAAYVALEAAAQAAALLGTAEEEDQPGVAQNRPGYLVGIRDLELDGGTFETSAELIVEVQRQASNPPLLVCRAVVTAGERQIMSGVLHVVSAP